MLQTADPKSPRVIVDVEHHRAMRDDALIEKMKHLAEAVKTTGTANPDGASELLRRYVVHNVFKDDPEVATWSPQDEMPRSSASRCVCAKRTLNRRLAPQAHYLMRKLLSACLVFVTCGIASAQQSQSSGPVGLPTIRAAAAVLFNAQTGEVLYKKNETDHRAVASTQKLLTALIVAESGNLSDLVTVTRSDTFADPTKLYLKPGEVYPRSQLLTALLVKSANDVARILARDNAGSVEQFAHKMNERMERLGGKSSHFINPNGLPVEGQYSTARDMACVARAVYYNPVLREIIKQRYFPFCYSSGKVGMRGIRIVCYAPFPSATA